MPRPKSKMQKMMGFRYGNPRHTKCPWATYCNYKGPSGKCKEGRGTTRPPKLFLVAPDSEWYIRVRSNCQNTNEFTHSGFSYEDWRQKVGEFLRAGWRFSAVPVGKYAGKLNSGGVTPARFAPKNTPEVRPATRKETDSFHGGDSASGEVNTPSSSGGVKKDSAGEGTNNGTHRGRRGGRSRRFKRSLKKGFVSIFGSGTAGSKPAYCPPDWRKPTPEEIQGAREAARIFLNWVGSGNPQEEEGFDLLGFVKAVEIGEDLRPYIYADIEKENMVRIVISPDHSGSTCSWSDVATAFAYALQEQAASLGIEVAVVPNFNGSLDIPGGKGMTWAEVMRKADVLLYMGDGDGYEVLQPLAKKGVRVVALDNACSSAREGRPRRINDPDIIWIDGVAGRNPWSFLEALRLL